MQAAPEVELTGSDNNNTEMPTSGSRINQTIEEVVLLSVLVTGVNHNVTFVNDNCHTSR
jgi:hypothetical protein